MGWETSNRSFRLPWDWKFRRAKVLARDYRLCKIRGIGCLIRASEVDHIIHGDDHSLENLRAVCTVCHKRKTSKEAWQGRMKRRQLRKRPLEQHPSLRKAG